MIYLGAPDDFLASLAATDYGPSEGVPPGAPAMGEGERCLGVLEKMLYFRELPIWLGEIFENG